MSDLTHYEKIITMLVRGEIDKWWYPYELLGSGELFVGYKAPARISELAIKYPQAIESKWEGKYKIFRFRFENKDELIQSLPVNLGTLVVQELNKRKLLTVDVI